MSWLFGKKKKPAVPTPQEHIEEINKAIENLHKKEEYYENKILMEEKKAIEFKKKGNKKKALECMRRKKLIEQRRDKMSNMIFNLEPQKCIFREVQTTSNVFNVFKQNNETMKKQFAADDIDDVEKLMDEIQEMDAITQMLPGPIGTDMDEDELDVELATLMEKDRITEITQVAPQNVEVDEGEERHEQSIGDFG